MYTSALQILVERISVFVAEHDEFTEAILILDSRMKGMNNEDGTVACSHMSYIFGHETGKTFTNILEVPAFGDSRISSGLQIVDIFAANLFTNHYCHHSGDVEGAQDYTHMQQYWEKLKELQFVSQNTVDGYTMYGYRAINHVRPPDDTY
jgi:hypothetical protein